MEFSLVETGEKARKVTKDEVVALLSAKGIQYAGLERRSGEWVMWQNLGKTPNMVALAAERMKLWMGGFDQKVVDATATPQPAAPSLEVDGTPTSVPAAPPVEAPTAVISPTQAAFDSGMPAEVAAKFNASGFEVKNDGIHLTPPAPGGEQPTVVVIDPEKKQMGISVDGEADVITVDGGSVVYDDGSGLAVAVEKIDKKVQPGVDPRIFVFDKNGNQKWVETPGGYRLLVVDDGVKKLFYWDIEGGAWFLADKPNDAVIISVEKIDGKTVVSNGFFQWQREGNKWVPFESDALHQVKIDKLSPYKVDLNDYVAKEKDGKVEIWNISGNEVVGGEGRWALKYYMEHLVDPNTLVKLDFVPKGLIFTPPQKAVDYLFDVFVQYDKLLRASPKGSPNGMEDYRKLLGLAENEHPGSLPVMLHKFADGKFAYALVLVKPGPKMDDGNRYLFYQDANKKYHLVPIMRINEQGIMGLYYVKNP